MSQYTLCFQKRGVELLAITHQLLTNFENSFTLETAMNYLQNKYNTFCRLLKTSLYDDYALQTVVIGRY